MFEKCTLNRNKIIQCNVDHIFIKYHIKSAKINPLKRNGMNTPAVSIKESGPISKPLVLSRRSQRQHQVLFFISF